VQVKCAIPRRTSLSQFHLRTPHSQPGEARLPGCVPVEERVVQVEQNRIKGVKYACHPTIVPERTVLVGPTSPARRRRCGRAMDNGGSLPCAPHRSGHFIGRDLPVGPKTRFGTRAATGCQQPDKPAPLNDLDRPQTYAHPWTAFRRERHPAGMSDPVPIIEFMSERLVADKPAWDIDLVPCENDDPVVMPLEHMEARICELAGHLTAATARFLLLVGDFDARGGWASWELPSCAAWLSDRHPGNGKGPGRNGTADDRGAGRAVRPRAPAGLARGAGRPPGGPGAEAVVAV